MKKEQVQIALLISAFIFVIGLAVLAIYAISVAFGLS